MPRKPMTAEEKKAFGEKMKVARAAKKADRQTAAEPANVSAQPIQATTDNNDIQELLRRIQELESRQTPTEVRQQQTVEVGRGGSLIGTYEKYITDVKHYPDPRERLALEPRLRRFSFNDNFELDFNVGMSSYKTIDGINTKEPKFVLKLIRIIYDDDTGEKTDKRYVATQLIFFEDPDTALVIAQDNNIDVEAFGEKQFLDEMRYLRMRDWLLDCFYPPPIAKVKERKEVVIGNRLVEVYTVTSEEAQDIDLTKKP